MKMVAATMLISYHDLAAQSSDPFPSKIGDIWEYKKVNTANGIQELVRKRVIDRIVRDDGLYEVRYSGGFRTVVYDTLGRVYTINTGDSLEIWLDFMVSQNDVYSIGNKEMRVDTVYFGHVFGNNIRILKFSLWLGGVNVGLKISAWTVGEGIGVLLAESFEADYEYETLEGAVVEGITYGKTLHVSPSIDTPLAGAMNLEANYPNPVRNYSVFSWKGESKENHHILLFDNIGRITWDSGPLSNVESKSIVWNRTSENGRVSPGSYFYAVFEESKPVSPFNRLEVY
jgi:hypothetical protein